MHLDRVCLYMQASAKIIDILSTYIGFRVSTGLWRYLQAVHLICVDLSNTLFAKLRSAWHVQLSQIEYKWFVGDFLHSVEHGIRYSAVHMEGSYFRGNSRDESDRPVAGNQVVTHEQSTRS
jgi:hypothetical protein